MDVSTKITIFDVAPADDSTWLIVVNGAVLGAFRERKSAVDVARNLAMRHRPSRLLTRSSNGDIDAITPFADESRNQDSEKMSLVFPHDDHFQLG